MKRKWLAVGIILLFLTINIIPIVGCFSVEKHTSITNSVKEELNTITKTESRDIYVILHGEMGENGWYISPYIHFEIIATNGSEVVSVYYKIDSGSWLTYTAEFLISTEGIHFLYLKVIDQYGNEWNFSFVIKFDFTPPIIVLHKENMLLHTIKFIADVSDMTSGVWRVEFYLDDELKVTDYDFPFEWIWKGTDNHTVTAKVFDWAGHSASSSISTPYIQSHVQNSLNNLQITQLLHYLITPHLRGVNPLLN
jgi:hypothetical protein